MIIDVINRLFGGDINDKRPLHINSICRIAYAGYLKYHKKHNCKEIAVIMNSPYKTTTDRVKKHRDTYEVDLLYRTKFDNLLKQEL